MPGKKTVLVVDDETDAIAITETILSDLDGVSTISADSGKAALAKAKKAKPDLILLDIQMPGMDGFGVFSQLRDNAATADIPIIMVTGVEEKTGIGFSADDMKDYLGKEPEGYIEKPIDAEDLQKQVAAILGL